MWVITAVLVTTLSTWAQVATQREHRVRGRTDLNPFKEMGLSSFDVDGAESKTSASSTVETPKTDNLVKEPVHTGGGNVAEALPKPAPLPIPAIGLGETDPPVQSGQSPSSAGWNLSFTPYLFAPGLIGTVGVDGITADIDLSFWDIAKNLKFILMGAFEARKGRLVILNDVVWIKLRKEFDTPFGLYSGGKVGVNLLIWEPQAGYRMFKGKRGHFDVLGGVRLASNRNELTFNPGILPGIDVAGRKTWAAPVFVARGAYGVTRKFFLSGDFDIGGGGGTHITTQFNGEAGYRFTKRLSLVGGYRYIKMDYDDDDNGYLFDARLKGILVGLRFDF
jgi:hypothetical protein